MSPIRPYRVTVAAGDQRTTVEILLDEDERKAVAAIARAVNDKAGEGAESSPRLYVERRFAGVRASGGAA